MKKLILAFLLILSTVFAENVLENIGLRAKEKIRVPTTFFNSVDSIDEIDMIRITAYANVTATEAVIGTVGNAPAFWADAEYAITNGMRFQVLKIGVSRSTVTGAAATAKVDVQLNGTTLKEIYLADTEDYIELTYPMVSNLNAPVWTATAVTVVSNSDTQAYYSNASASGLSSNMIVQFFSTNLPSTMSLQTNYWVSYVPSPGTNFTVSVAEGGAQLFMAVSDLGSGLTYRKANLINFTGDLIDGLGGTNNKIIVDLWGIVYTPE